MAGFFPRSKKGNLIVEGLTILIVITIFAIAGIFGHQVFTELNDEIQNDSTMSTTAKETSGDLQTLFPDWVDNTFLFIFIMLIIFVIVSVFLIDTHPIFFAITVLLMIALFVATIFIGNAYNDLASDSTVASYANDMGFMGWVMQHIAETMIGVIFMTGILLFVKIKMM